MHRPIAFVRSRARSVACALAGVAFLLRSQRNAQLHLAATAAVSLAAWIARVPARDWCWLLVATALVWTAEAVNTAIELLCDYACVPPVRHEIIGRAKDVAAAAVLLSALAAAAIGVLVLAPPLIALCRTAP
jgi:diacylglycerol kinase (ATP)